MYQTAISPPAPASPSRATLGRRDRAVLHLRLARELLSGYLTERPRVVTEVLLSVQEVAVHAQAGVFTPITVRTSSAA
jgi:hypothetical protein